LIKAQKDEIDALQASLTQNTKLTADIKLENKKLEVPLAERRAKRAEL